MIPAVGATLADRYRLRARIGAGGSGEVWRALDEMLDREVAVKLVGTDVEPGRLRREARAAARVSHPNVVAVYDAGEVDGRAFLVMELVAGTDLATLVRHGGALTGGEVAVVARDLAAGLAAVHGAGFVHRDVTPGNLLVTTTGQVKLADLGTARVVDGDGVDQVTRTGLVVGTVDYLAPEQLSDAEPTAATDVYAAGLVLRTCATAVRPFGGGTVSERAARRLTGDPAPLSGVDGWIAAVVSAACRRDPGERPADGAALLRLLDELAPGPVEADRPRLAARSTAAATDDRPVRDPADDGSREHRRTAVLDLSTATTSAIPRRDDDDGAADDDRDVARTTAMDPRTTAIDRRTTAIDPRADVTDPPAAATDPPADAAGRRAAAADPPATDPHADVTDPHADVTDPPAATTDRPAAATDPPDAGPHADVSDPPPATTDPPAARTVPHGADRRAGGVAPPRDERTAGEATPRPAATPAPRRASRVGLAVVAIVATAFLVGVAVSSGQGSGTDGGGGGGTGGGDDPPTSYEVAAATDFDPLGGDGEHPNEVPNALDGDPATQWTTQQYTSPALGGLKEGVGLLLDLGEPRAVGEVVVDLGVDGVAVEVHVAEDRPDGAPSPPTLLASADDASGTVTLGGDAVTGRWVTVWFTRLGPSDGFQAAVREVSVRP